MVANHFLYSYHGNKRCDYKHFKDNICYDNIKNIVEPFAGSAAISFNIWKEYGDKFSYHLNDLDSNLYILYKLLKEEDIDVIFEKINLVKDKIKSEQEFNMLFKKIDKTIYEIIYLHKGSSFRFGRFNIRALTKKKYKPTLEQRLFSNFLKCNYVHVTSFDFRPLYDYHKTDKHVLLILDPPYINSCNTEYVHKSTHFYEYLSEDIKNRPATVILPLEKNDIVLNLFKEYNILVEWHKIYQITKKHVKFLLISNK